MRRLDHRLAGQERCDYAGWTAVLAAIRKAASAETKVTFSKDGKGAAGAAVGVVVIGETPYAEGEGDRADLKLAPEDAEAVANVKAAGIPVVVVLLSGRPMILGGVLDQADAVVAAWLPGTEGEGVTDVLFGDFKPAGKLSFTWPRVVGDKADAVFRVGYGLSY